MQHVTISTPQNVEISFPSSDLGKRVVAKTIDYIIIAILIWLIVKIYESIIGPLWFFGDYWSKTAIFILLFFPVYSYSFWFETFLRGRTPGKMVMKIQVMRIDGLPYTWENALIRWMFNIVDYLPVMGITGFIAILTTKNGQRLGDLAAGTVIVSTKKEIGIDQTILVELAEDYQPIFLNAIRLSDNDMRIIKAAFEGAVKNKDFKTIRELRDKIESVIHTGDKHMSDINFIQTIMKDFNYLTNK
jgi:uncharacterized RDD family membrane protein YckC